MVKKKISPKKTKSIPSTSRKSKVPKTKSKVPKTKSKVPKTKSKVPKTKSKVPKTKSTSRKSKTYIKKQKYLKDQKDNNIKKFLKIDKNNDKNISFKEFENNVFLEALGVDHISLSVYDLSNSVKFYKKLGFKTKKRPFDENDGGNGGAWLTLGSIDLHLIVEKIGSIVEGLHHPKVKLGNVNHFALKVDNFPL